ncbi:L,D-transpeptidase family protein [Colwellia sp. RSH04]|uniref:L,D-transpeptidase family protein n=1 Tax=Colwellia sp. RSH04 TaxID=2305464 RepID=UPI000E57F4BE|nr:L,D-transpeptidase family protein [Colwellia sp. RSH04]RHW78030.1 LysM peptidoglycan-binding domain-containing protein [Colwellia sp. RSH04]
MTQLKSLFYTCITTCFCLSLTGNLLAAEYDIPAGKQRLIGKLQYHHVKQGDYFQQIAEQYNVGFLALLAANPTIDPFLPEVGSQVVIPSAMLLPFIKREGIVVNLPELRLYYFDPNKNKVHVFPVGIGRQGLATPKATSYISEKRKNPVWRPTKAMKERYLTEKGIILADEVPAGPSNPFGKYALRLGTSEYLIHGTNKRFGIGMRASSGCVRMYDEDIKWLYENVPLQTRVRIIDQPIKMSYENGQQQLIEIHEPLTEEPGKPTIKLANAVQRFVGSNRSYWHQLLPVIEKPTGLVIELEENEEGESSRQDELIQ